MSTQTEQSKTDTAADVGSSDGLGELRAKNKSPFPTGWRVGVRDCACGCPLSYNDWEWGREWTCLQCGYEDTEYTDGTLVHAQSPNSD